MSEEEEALADSPAGALTLAEAKELAVNMRDCIEEVREECDAAGAAAVAEFTVAFTGEARDEYRMYALRSYNCFAEEAASARARTRARINEVYQVRVYLGDKAEFDFAKFVDLVAPLRPPGFGIGFSMRGDPHVFIGKRLPFIDLCVERILAEEEASAAARKE